MSKKNGHSGSETVNTGGASRPTRDEAAREFETAAQLDPTDPATHYRLARVYDRLGKPEAANKEREQHAKLVEAQQTAK